ncbi:MAG: hypothetical protein CEN89_651 [Candidatus Berkelbacteria bacterium Licking1014_7]|uniref:Uncharacterized protein n=1 Tax=Candidatus Berkelbacteria bacterium Licking1014_7 TaxID=2017147 RepID=A0A554LI25_9BACT|nr:MAG: hypothetical protein CEN89_651 [Candidatus Berkelbacteria bacterium Licking1014_7]
MSIEAGSKTPEGAQDWKAPEAGSKPDQNKEEEENRLDSLNQAEQVARKEMRYEKDPGYRFFKDYEELGAKIIRAFPKSWGGLKVTQEDLMEQNYSVDQIDEAHQAVDEFTKNRARDNLTKSILGLIKGDLHEIKESLSLGDLSSANKVMNRLKMELTHYRDAMDLLSRNYSLDNREK